MNVSLSSSDVPLGAVLTCSLLNVPYKWDSKTEIRLSASVSLTSSASLSRHISRVSNNIELYPCDPLHRSEVDHWLLQSANLCGNGSLENIFEQLNKALAPTNYLVSTCLSIADLEVFGSLYRNPVWQQKVKESTAPSHLLRWYNLIHHKVKGILSTLPLDVKDRLDSISANQIPANNASNKREAEGKFVDLPGAKMGEVVVRFPPEASGYLHIGHAKAALLNQHYQKAFKGKLIMRFDDTNPDKENIDFEKAILEDLKLLDIAPDQFTFTSDYFKLMLEMCEKLIKAGKAYVDNTEAEQMKKEREEKKESRNRNNDPELNMDLFTEMKKGSPKGLSCCVRAKIDMNSVNGCMRDPTIYRCKNEPHPRTKNAFRVYPTYDFACPIVDSIEGVTHALRTTEYHDRDEQFAWFIKNLGLRPVHIYEYSRLNMNNTVLSKRKLTWFVDKGIVDGWSDPRFPTVRGIVRRGMTVEGLKDFIIAQGSSRSVVNMEWDKIWSFNRKVIDRDACRFTALHGDLVPVDVTGCRDEIKKAPRHPKDPSKGNKDIFISSKIWIEKVDAKDLVEGQNATFINWGNLMIVKIHRSNGEITGIEAKANLDNTDYKKTLKITWLSETSEAPWTPMVCSFFDHIITKSVLSKEEDFKNFVNPNTRTDVFMQGDHDLKNLKAGDIIQLQRKGFFRVDETYKPFSPSSCKETPLVLFHIPDGHSKDNPYIPSSSSSSSQKENSSSKTKSSDAQIGSKSNVDALAIHNEIKAQGDKIRKMKSDKVDKTVVMPEVEILKSLKMKFKDESGKEWSPDIDIKELNGSSKFQNSDSQVSVLSKEDAFSIHTEIKVQGDKIRKLKGEKADKSVIMSEVEILKSLKAKFKNISGKEWTPDIDIKEVKGSLKTESKNNSDILDIHNAIKAQGDKVRELKAQKAEKEVIKNEVDKLLALKKEFSVKTKSEWKPDTDINKFINKEEKGDSKDVSCGMSASDDLKAKIKVQGDKIRQMKASKADKGQIKSEVDVLLALKSKFKDITGVEWTPEVDAKPAHVKNSENAPDKNIMDVNNQIKSQGDKIRNMKASNSDKASVKAEVDILLKLKSKFKEIAGYDWKPDLFVSSSPPSTTLNSQSSDISNFKTIHEKIKVQGNKVRELKSQKASKETITAEVNTLLDLKKQFKEASGIDWSPELDISTMTSSPSTAKLPRPSSKSSTKTAVSKVKEVNKIDESSLKRQTRLGLEFKKLSNFSEWYSQVITKSEMIEYYNVSGCYILRPWSYRIWEFIKDFFDAEIKKLGVENAYFPIFVSKEALEKEKDHLEDFSPEVAWVTKSGSSDMAEPVAIRPTSETVMYPAFAKWVQSHRDLPIRINQWNNVVRWEFKQPTPFLRTREFLWQEGHTAFATRDEAIEEVHTIANLYAQVYEDLLAVPVVKGKKTAKEKFAGADFSITTEAFISASGRGIQGATSHHLGQNFSKMVDIIFDDPKTQEKSYAYQNSWGITTRTIGVMVMIHGDDKGLVIPPNVAPVQVVIMPVGITASTTDDLKNNLIKYCSDIAKILNEKELRCKCDFRDNVTPAWKFNHWEQKGVPIRLEIGPRELNDKKVFAVRRDTGEKTTLDRFVIERRIFALLETIQSDMLEKAREDLDSHIFTVHQWSDFVEKLNFGNLLLAPFCGEEDCEDDIKKNSAREEQDSSAPSMGAKSLCIPFDQPETPSNDFKCIYTSCKKKAQYYTLFGRSY